MKYKCVFCGKEHEGYENSCWPIYNGFKELAKQFGLEIKE